MSNEPKEGSVGVTAPQEPLKLTMFLLTRTTWTDSTVIGLYFDKTKARTEADRLEAAKGQGDGWQEYYVNPIGVADAPARNDAAELRAVISDAAAFLKRIDDWEGSVILADEVWATGDGMPKLTRELYDQWIELQDERNRLRAALAATGGQP